MQKLLLIEPDFVLGRIYTKALTDHGYDTTTVKGAQTAISVLDKMDDFAMIILEIQLVDHGGVEFIYELRSYKEWQNLPIIIHTMVPLSSLQFPKNFYDNFGVVEYLYKPSTSIDKLLNTVDSKLAVNTK
jgi:DNA-binding response OmpR family regulator